MENKYQTIIRAGRPWWRIDWRELFEYQDLLWLMVKRDLTAIYKQTILGPLWFIIQPLVTTIVYTIIFGKVAKISTDGIPQFVFYMAGTISFNAGAISIATTLFILISGLFIFNKVQRNFVDTI